MRPFSVIFKHCGANIHRKKWRFLGNYFKYFHYFPIFDFLLAIKNILKSPPIHFGDSTVFENDRKKISFNIASEAKFTKVH